MRISTPWLWIALAAFLLLLPGTAGRLILDLVGGITLLVVLLPLLGGAAALVGWQLLRRRLRNCPACGFTSMGSAACPSCGAPLDPDGLAMTMPDDPDPRDVTITVAATPVSDAKAAAADTAS